MKTLLVTAVFLGALAVSTLSAQEPQHGDTNFDGRITAKDALLALQWDAGIPSVLALEPCPNGVGNVYLDSYFDSRDALVILQYVAGQIDSLPYEVPS